MTKREKIMLIVAIIILIFLFALKSVIIPTIDGYYAITEEYDETVYELEKNKLQLKNINKYAHTVEKINSEIKLLEQIFYKGNMSDIRIEVLKYLDGQIKDHGLDIESKEFNIEQLSQSKVNNDLVAYDTNQYGSTQYERYDVDRRQRGQQIIVKPIKMTYRAQIRGSYQQVLSFLEGLASYHKFYTVSQLDIKVGSDDEQLAVFVVIESYCKEGDIGDKEKI